MTKKSNQTDYTDEEVDILLRACLILERQAERLNPDGQTHTEILRENNKYYAITSSYGEVTRKENNNE